MKLFVGKTYIVKCGWGNTVAKLEYVVSDLKDGHEIYYFKEMGKTFRFISHDTKDILEVK